MNFDYDRTSAEEMKIPRYIQVKYQLQKSLLQQHWQFDRPIPSEQTLAAEYNVSIGTIRKAVEGLVEDGILIKQQGRGTFVKQPHIAGSMSRFYRNRSKDGVIPMGLVKKMEKIDGNERINGLLGIAASQPLIYLERVRISDNKVVLSDYIWLPFERFDKLLDIPLENFENWLYPVYFQKCGQFVVSAKEQLSFMANRADKYLTGGKPEAVIKFCRLVKGLDGAILEYRESYGLAKDFYYETTIS